MSENETVEPVLAVRDLRTHFCLEHSALESALARIRGDLRVLRAVDGVSFDLRGGETLGLVGESGCGKTTLGRSVLRLIDPTDGHVLFHGTDLAHVSERALRELRPRMQVVFQDPGGALNPRRTIGAAVGRALDVVGVRRSSDQRGRCTEMLESVGLQPELSGRYPHQLSGGQKQRACIARALATDPEFIVADEPVSSLDVSVQAQILNLLVELQETRGLSMLFISHDLSVVRQVSHRVAVMYAGRIMEIGPTKSVIGSPLHPYTQCLIEAVPRLRHQWEFAGEGPSLSDVAPVLRPESGCPFHTRCPAEQSALCSDVEPELTEVARGHHVACHLAQEPPRAAQP